MTESLRRVAIVGGSRIPFCRSNTIYSDKSNLDMLSTAIDGVVDRFDLQGEQLDEVLAKISILRTYCPGPRCTSETISGCQQDVR